jgi:catechol 2,3-dioxygenase-like lactoylglutathione lyase family enzyme
VVVEHSEQRVNRLVPFVRVIDVERSVAFYGHLGFTVGDVARYRDRLSWASLQSEGAGIMFEGTNPPIDPDRQRILFYLYSEDLAALREQLLAAGIEAGEIEDGSPGPSEQMRVTDPDGYVLMIAQIDWSRRASWRGFDAEGVADRTLGPRRAERAGDQKSSAEWGPTQATASSSLIPRATSTTSSKVTASNPSITRSGSISSPWTIA